MQLVSVISRDAELSRLLWRYRDQLGRFHIHPVLEQEASKAVPALPLLEFAGALIMDPDDQREVSGSLNRLSLEAQEAGSVDTVAVTSGGLIGEYNFGRAVGAMLKTAGWDAVSASAVILGGGPPAMSVARELSSLGVSRLVILADSRPEAEAAAPALAASTQLTASAFRDPMANDYLGSSDLIVRLDARGRVPLEVMGPHLTLADLVDGSVSVLRQQALGVGALSFNRRDFEAHFMALALGHVLGGQLTAEPFLSLFHGAARD